MTTFYDDILRKKNPELITFKVGIGQERWQDVQAWLREYEKRK